MRYEDKEKIKFIIVGDGEHKDLGIYEDAIYFGFCNLGYTGARLFTYKKYYFIEKSFFARIVNKIQSKLQFGPSIWRANQVLIRKCREYRPEFIFLYRARAIKAKTIKKIHNMGIKILLYNNDDPFSHRKWWYWREYRRSLRNCDIAFAYRKKNLMDYKKAGCRKRALLLPYYVKNRNYYIKHMESKDLNIPEVVFLGHYENDGRIEYLKMLVDAGIPIGLPDFYDYQEFFKENKNVLYLDSRGDNYNKILNATKIALCFFSTLNSDTYTRRCFEIPPTKTLMIAPKNKDMEMLFKENVEIVYYETKDELLEKVKYYLAHDEERKRIAENCYQRIKNAGHSAEDRARQIIKVYRSNYIQRKREKY